MKIPSIEAKDVKIVLEMIFCAVLPMAMFLLVASSRSACRRLWTTAVFSSFMKCNCNKCTTLIFYQGIFLQGGLHWYNGTLQYTGTYRLLMKTIEKNANTVLLDFAVLRKSKILGQFLTSSVSTYCLFVVCRLHGDISIYLHRMMF